MIYLGASALDGSFATHLTDNLLTTFEGQIVEHHSIVQDALLQLEDSHLIQHNRIHIPIHQDQLKDASKFTTLTYDEQQTHLRHRY